ncbi:MAG TPA: ferritin-like domain-containing protein [Burkholderiaceae bacterium]|jgi:bacterioferritin
MSKHSLRVASSKAKQAPAPEPGEPTEQLSLDQDALDQARNNLDAGPITPSYGPWREQIVKLLNDALATELVCVMRYKRHYFTARGLASPRVAEEFLEHANEESAHGDLLAERIVQLGGEPDFSPNTLLERSHADYDESSDLKDMIRANLVAERIAIEAYRQMVTLIGPKDPSTRRILEGILHAEEEHAEDLSDLLKE